MVSISVHTCAAIPVSGSHFATEETGKMFWSLNHRNLDAGGVAEVIRRPSCGSSEVIMWVPAAGGIRSAWVSTATVPACLVWPELSSCPLQSEQPGWDCSGGAGPSWERGGLLGPGGEDRLLLGLHCHRTVLSVPWA